MTSSSRRAHIDKALAEYRSKPAGTGETARIPLRGGSTVLEVIEVPLDVPILNADSFRIAPALADHPQRDVVINDPESPEAQAIVSDLVRKSHRNAAQLKESLLDGQDNPGVITRSGKLINANSRCVLLRELVAEGRLTSAALRVIVLPGDVTNSEELGLESVLQQQQEFKDEYTFVSKLMMIEKLHTSAGMQDRQIAASLRERKGATLIADLREVLVLMNRARHLTTVPRPLSAFVGPKDQQENWLELLRQVRDIDKTFGREAGNDHIRGWLLAFYAGFDSVHQLRNVRGDWVKRDVLPILGASDGTAAKVASAATAPVAIPETADDREEKAASLGLDLLGEPDDAPEPSYQSDPAIQRLLDLLVDATTKTHGPVTVDNDELDAEHVVAAIKTGVDEGIKAVKRRNAGANKLARPQTLATTASTNLLSAYEALAEVIGEPDFPTMVTALNETLAEVQQRLTNLTDYLETLDDTDTDTGDDGNPEADINPDQTGDTAVS